MSNHQIGDNENSSVLKTKKSNTIIFFFQFLLYNLQISIVNC